MTEIERLRVEIERLRTELRNREWCYRTASERDAEIERLEATLEAVSGNWHQAVDEIERLQRCISDLRVLREFDMAEIERLRAALAHVAPRPALVAVPEVS